MTSTSTASSLDHPNIGTIYEIDTTDEGLTFIAMAYYEGEILRERIDRGELIAEETMKICSSIAAGLDKAHAGGIVHRDIKPSNILFSGDGEMFTDPDPELMHLLETPGPLSVGIRRIRT